MKHRPHRTRKTEEHKPSLPKDLVKIYSDGEPENTRRGINLFVYENLFLGFPGNVYIDNVPVEYSYN